VFQPACSSSLRVYTGLSLSLCGLLMVWWVGEWVGGWVLVGESVGVSRTSLLLLEYTSLFLFMYVEC